MKNTQKYPSYDDTEPYAVITRPSGNYNFVVNLDNLAKDTSIPGGYEEWRAWCIANRIDYFSEKKA